MKHGWLASLALMAAIGLGIWATVSESRAAFGATVVRLCYDNIDAAPWRYGRGGGLDFQLLEPAGKRTGVSFQFEAMPRQVCLDRLRDGEVDGAIGEPFGADHLLSKYGTNWPRPIESTRLHSEGQIPSYLVFSPQFVERHPEMVSEIGQAIAAVQASARYRILERQIVSLLGQG